MSEDGRRVPAWRRLGLALKNETQSGVAVPEASVVGDAEHSSTPYDEQKGSHDHHLPPIETASNGESPKLGKRKHQNEPADDAQTSKRGKISDVDHSDDPVSLSHVSSEGEQTSAPLASAEQPQPDVSQPKGGDPNYRKKKAKPKNKRRVNDEPLPERAAAKPERTSLSPGAGNEQQTLLTSTELDHSGIVPATTPQQLRGLSRRGTKDSTGSPSAIDRRKSVTFTPDTKRVDGHSAQNLFKQWVAEQRVGDAEAGSIEERVSTEDGDTDAGAAEKRDSTKSRAKEKHEKKDKKKEKQQDESSRASAVVTASPDSKASPATKGKKKDPALYTSYLDAYFTDRANWKFNKAKQNDVIDNATNIFRIPQEHSEALIAYVQGLKGAGAIKLLTSKCESALEDLDKEDAKAMDDPKERQALYDEALRARVSKERKRRKVEGDMESLSEHPSGDNFIRRLRRERAEALLIALGRTTPILPAMQTNGINPLVQNLAPKRDSKKRKRRANVSSDESSSDSSSDSSSSDEDSSSSDDESEDSDDDKSNSDEENGGDCSDTGSSGGSGSGGDGSESDESGSDSDSDSD